MQMKNHFLKNVLLIILIFFLFSLNSNISAQTNLDSLIHKVQINSQNTYDSIDSVLFSGHTKSHVYFAFGPFDVKLIPYLEEYYFDGFWIKPDSIRILVKAQRIVVPDSEKVNVGKNSFPLPNPFHYLYDPSLIGFKDSTKQMLWPIYPFSLGAD